MTEETKGGYIMLYRKLFEWEWWNDQNTTRLFITILLLANWKDKRWRGRVIPRGSCWTSIAKLSEKSGLTIQQTRNSLNKLISTNEITSEATNGGRLITVVKYGVYQLAPENATSETTSERPVKEQASNKRTNNQKTTTNNINKTNKQKTIIKQQQGPGSSMTIDLNELLSTEEMIRLSKKYKYLDSLLDEVEADIRAKEKTVRYPFRYVDGYARNKGWPRKETE